MENTTNYTKLVSDRLSERGRREYQKRTVPVNEPQGLLVTGGEEQVQLLKQQLKQREQEVSCITIITHYRHALYNTIKNAC